LSAFAAIAGLLSRCYPAAGARLTRRWYGVRMPGLGLWEILLIVFLILLLFGAKRLPEIGRSLGLGMREFKEGIRDEDENRELNPPVSSNADVRATAAVGETERTPRG
jgi:sec-independent protein translocase protein TatA